MGLLYFKYTYAFGFRQAGTSMYAVGITEQISFDELKAIGVDGFWNVTGFQFLGNVLSDLLQELTSVQCSSGKYEKVLGWLNEW